MMKTLTTTEKKIKKELLEKYAREMALTPLEALELKDIIQKDGSFDEGLRLLMLTGLGTVYGMATHRIRA